MFIKNYSIINFSARELELIFGSFVHGKRYIPEELYKKIGSLDERKEIYENLWPPIQLMRDIRYMSEESLPSERKLLMNGHTVYWDELCDAVVFLYSGEKYIIYEPENSKEFYDALTEIPFPFTATDPLSIYIRVSLFELGVMLTMVKEVYKAVHEEWNEFHALFGGQPEEALKLMQRLQKEIDTRKAAWNGHDPEPRYQIIGSRKNAKVRQERHPLPEERDTKMSKENAADVTFLDAEFRILYGAAREIYLEIPQGFDEEIGLPGEFAGTYQSLSAANRMLRAIQAAGEEELPEERKVLRGGYTAAYWEPYSMVVFRSPDEKYLVHVPENGREFYDALIEMPFPFETTDPLSIRMFLGPAELEAMLTMVREIYKIVGEEFHARFGQPEEAQKLMEKLQNEIDTHKNSEL